MDKVKDLRIKQCMSQSDLADKAGVGLSTIVNIERCHHYPKFKTMRKIALALGVEPSELNFGE